MAAAKTAEIAARLAGSSATAQAERSEKQRRLGRAREPHGSFKPAQADLVGAAVAGISALSPRDDPHPYVPPSKLAEVVILDESSPAQLEGEEEVAEPIEAEARMGELAAQIPLPKPTHRPDKELVEVPGTAVEAAAPPRAANDSTRDDMALVPEGDFKWPFPHRIDELNANVWGKALAMLMDTLGEVPPYNEEPSEDNKFIPKKPLEKRSSVLESRMVQSRVLEQFSHPRDDDFLTKMPSFGLHQALNGYLLRGALVEQELFSRLELAQSLPANFNKALEDERMAREVAEKRVAALEAERVAWTRSEGRWRRELETREEMIKGLQAHRSKQSAMITKLKEEMGHYQHEILEREGHIKYLTEEVEGKKRERLDAQECARSDHMAAQNLKSDLKEERSAHQASLATIQALEGRLAFLDSEAYRVEIVEKYHDSPLGKVEVSLACKAGFDYLLELLLVSLDPPQIASITPPASPTASMS